MNQYQYEVNVYSPEFESTYKTNDPRMTIELLLDYVGRGYHVEVINGFTGEVLCVQNHPEPYMQDDFGLMVLGRLMERVWG